MRQLIKQLAKFLLGLGSFHLSRIRSDLDEVLTQVKKQGFNPQTVIDVGVANGTPDLYQAFPDVRFILVEPLKEFEPYMASLKNKFNVEYEVALASDSEGVCVLNVHEDLCGSSMLKEIEGGVVDGSQRSVPSITLDSLLTKYSIKGPILLKIDVQGAELQVLNGASEVLEQAEGVILEVSLFGFFEGGPQFFDVVAYMQQRGFVVGEIFDGRNRPLDGALAQVDILFVKERGIFRKKHGYATPQQRARQNKKLMREMVNH